MWPQHHSLINSQRHLKPCLLRPLLNFLYACSDTSHHSQSKELDVSKCYFGHQNACLPHAFLETPRPVHSLPVEISGRKDTEQKTNFNDGVARLEMEVWIQGPKSFLCLPSWNNSRVMGRSPNSGKACSGESSFWERGVGGTAQLPKSWRPLSPV